jgi:hypothetical protein
MTKYRPFLLALACLGLAALVAFDNREAILAMLSAPDPVAAHGETEGDGIAKSEPPANLPAQAAPPQPTASLAGNPLAEFDKTQLENWVKRPLFAPSRKRPPPQDAKAAAAPPPSPPDYQLLGVLLNPKRTIAVLRSEQTGTDVRVQVGDMIGGWLVASVEREAVTLKRDEEEPQIIRFKKSCPKSAGGACP